MKKLIIFALLALAGRAEAQTILPGYNLVNTATGGFQTAPTVIIACPPTTGNIAIACSFGGGGGGGSNAAAGTTGAAAPSSSSNTAFVNGSGVLTAVSPSNPFPVTGTVGVSGTVPVSGTFFQATQPVSGTVGISGTVPVSGTFFQATQPVSGTVGISGTVPVSGTFFQATQPVSGTVGISAAQQAKPGNTSVSVAASTSTLVWTTSTSARTLRIVPPATNATCYMQDDGTAASATSTPIPGGYVFNLQEPPPSSNIYAYCTTAAVISVSQGN